MRFASVSFAALLAASASAATSYKSPWTGGSVTLDGKTVTSAGYTDWKLEGEGSNQTMRQELVQTLTFGKDTEALEEQEVLQVYNI